MKNKRKEYWVDPIAIGRSTGLKTDHLIFSCYNKKKHEKSIRVREVLSDDDKYLQDARELCALMAEGEGNDLKVYMSIANQAMEKLDVLLSRVKK